MMTLPPLISPLKVSALTGFHTPEGKLYGLCDCSDLAMAANQMTPGYICDDVRDNCFVFAAQAGAKAAVGDHLYRPSDLYNCHVIQLPIHPLMNSHSGSPESGASFSQRQQSKSVRLCEFSLEHELLLTNAAGEEEATFKQRMGDFIRRVAPSFGVVVHERRGDILHTVIRVQALTPDPEGFSELTQQHAPRATLKRRMMHQFLTEHLTRHGLSASESRENFLLTVI